ncbi:YgiT-type zinc finger protein [Desulfobacterales bacterium HSG17]|nr:YgiT-type zinc finger protein [Desulfobacterales bacterium HSG17]
MNCIYCNGIMKKRTAPFHVDRRGYHLTLDDIPAWVCTQCGELYFEESAVESIQNMLISIDRQTEIIAKVA